jgi:hypothetical protein
MKTQHAKITFSVLTDYMLYEHNTYGLYFCKVTKDLHNFNIHQLGMC